MMACGGLRAEAVHGLRVAGLSCLADRRRRPAHAAVGAGDEATRLVARFETEGAWPAFGARRSRVDDIAAEITRDFYAKLRERRAPLPRRGANLLRSPMHLAMMLTQLPYLMKLKLARRRAATRRRDPVPFPGYPPAPGTAQLRRSRAVRRGRVPGRPAQHATARSGSREKREATRTANLARRRRRDGGDHVLDTCRFHG